MPSAFITGLAGPTLLDAERSFLASARPAGVILFARNCVAHDQIRRLVGEALDAIGNADTLVLIDQEGGRVQRLRPPIGRALPAAAAFGALYAGDPEDARRLAFLVSRQNAADLRALGINTNCAPVLDVPVPGAHDVIGNRSDMPVGAAGGHYHAVSDRGFAGKIDGDDILGLHLIKALEDNVQGLRGVTHLRDRLRHGTGLCTGPRDDLCAQGILSFFGLRPDEMGTHHAQV